MATSVVMMGAAAVVANPVVSPPADIRVSASDLDASSDTLNVLHPGFLDSIDLAQSHVVQSRVVESPWPTEGLRRVLSLGINEDATPGYNSLNDALMRATAESPVLFIAVMAFASPSELSGLPSIAGEALRPEDLLRTLASLSSGFGEAGANFVEDAGMTPAVINELAQQVFAGSMTPDDALRRLIAVPLSASVGHPSLTDNPEIDGMFKNGLLQAIIDVVVGNTPPSLRGGESGVIDTIAAAVTAAGTNVRDAVDPSTTKTSEKPAAATTTATDDTHTSAATPEKEVTKTEQTTSTGDSNGAATTSPRPSRAAGDVAESIRERIRQILNDLGSKRNISNRPNPTGSPGPSEPGSAGGIGTPGAGPSGSGPSDAGSSVGGAGSAPGGAPGN